MKKFTALMSLIAFTSMLNAQNLTLFNEAGDNITNGTAYLQSEISFYTMVRNNSEELINVKVKVVSISAPKEALLQICWTGCFSNPEPGTIFLLPIAIPAASTDSSSFDITYYPLGFIENAQCVIKFYNQENPDDSANVTFIYYPTKIQQIDQMHTLSVYPNPAGEQLFLSMNEPFTKPLQITIYDPASRKIRDISVSEGKFPQSINISDLNPGLYFISVVTAEKKVTSRFVVER